MSRYSYTTGNLTQKVEKNGEKINFRKLYILLRNIYSGEKL